MSRFPDRGVQRLIGVNLAAQTLIVVTGGIVRLTESGLGCPDWPRCAAGSITPTGEQAEGWHKWIEFGNRTLTGLVLLTAVLALTSAIVLARRGYRPQARTWAALVIAGVLAQAVIGGVTVLTGLQPWTVSVHFLVSMLLITFSTLALYDGRRMVESPPVPATEVRAEIRLLTVAIAVLTGVILVLGTVVTGSGPHAGDAQTPRLGLDARAMSWLHADLVMLFAGLLVALLIALRLTDAPPVTRRSALAVLVVTVAQGGIGYTQYASDLPESLVALHMLGACLLVITISWLTAAVHDRALPGVESATVQAPSTNGSTATAANSSVR
ncbi:MAG: heme A synthase [Micrococcales bacterium]|nr:MAG: heme A synthase [Micrococcales bacterium]PIE27293.1 MAG: heme A synthase [Micrococcales bacterium]